MRILSAVHIVETVISNAWKSLFSNHHYFNLSYENFWVVLLLKTILFTYGNILFLEIRASNISKTNMPTPPLPLKWRQPFWTISKHRNQENLINLFLICFLNSLNLKLMYTHWLGVKLKITLSDYDLKMTTGSYFFWMGYDSYCWLVIVIVFLNCTKQPFSDCKVSIKYVVLLNWSLQYYSHTLPGLHYYILCAGWNNQDMMHSQ